MIQRTDMFHAATKVLQRICLLWLVVAVAAAVVGISAVISSRACAAERDSRKPSAGSVAPAPSGDLYVLAVGVSDYREPKIRKLNFSAKDATDFGNLMQKQHGLFRRTFVKILTNEKATKRSIEKFLTGDLRRSGKDDTIILFFSGHGVFDPQQTDDFYFCPYDLELGYYAATAVKMSDLSFLKGLETKRVLLVADACHAGGFSEWTAKDLPSDLGVFLKDFRETTGRVIITSAGPNEQSWEMPEIDGKSAGNSVFTYYLLKGLQGKADANRDGEVTVSEAYEYSYAMTKEATGGFQHPQFEGRHSGAFPITLSGNLVPGWKLKKALMQAVRAGNIKKVRELEVQILDFAGVRDERNRTPLMAASANGHVPLVKLFLSKRPDLGARSDTGDTALITASAKGRVEVVKLLVSKGADPNVKNKNDESALTLAARAGHTAVVEELLRAGANIRAINARGNSALALAAYKGYADIVKLLLAAGADPNITDFKGRTPLSHAARYGHAKVVKMILAQTARPKSPMASENLIPAVLAGDVVEVKKSLDAGAKVDTRTAYGDTPLSLAAGLGYHDVVQLLLDKGAEVNCKTRFGSTALTWAANNGKSAEARTLMENGAHVDVRDDGQSTPLTYAAQNNHLSLVKLLLEKGAQVNNASKSGNTPLILASRNGNQAIVSLLLKRGARPNDTNNAGDFPLLIASANGHRDVVKLLLDHGADVHKRDRDGYTPLMAASAAGHEEIVRLLPATTATINYLNRKGETALFLAAKNGHVSIAKTLLARGADPSLETREGISPSSIAETGGHAEIVSLLERRSRKGDARSGAN